MKKFDKIQLHFVCCNVATANDVKLINTDSIIIIVLEYDLKLHNVHILYIFI